MWQLNLNGDTDKGLKGSQFSAAFAPVFFALLTNINIPRHHHNHNHNGHLALAQPQL